jgi:DHA1 family bicyclomycin/chloramphenicol resistance-like MFS transporter
MGFIALPLIHTVIALAGGETVWVFAVMQGLTMFCFGLISGNFGAMAMEPMGRIAGTAASVQGVISTLGGALLGFAMGQQFNGTVVPMTAGFVVMGLVALACVLWAEHGRLFSARHGETPRAA